jgi:hypothetical protein
MTRFETGCGAKGSAALSLPRGVFPTRVAFGGQDRFLPGRHPAPLTG